MRDADGSDIRSLFNTMPKESRRHSKDEGMREARERAMQIFEELDELEDSVNNGTGGSARHKILDRLGEAIMAMESADLPDFDEEI
jgi:hypothetical protein